MVAREWESPVAAVQVGLGQGNGRGSRWKGGVTVVGEKEQAGTQEVRVVVVVVVTAAAGCEGSCELVLMRCRWNPGRMRRRMT